MMLSKKAGRSLLALVAVLALALTACSSGSEGGSPSSSPDGTTATGAGGAANRDGTVKVGYDLVQAGAATGFTLDPAAATYDQNDALQYLIFGRLMRPTDDGDLVPDLAESATLVDVNTIQVALRPGVTFQDGSPFDAEAVKAGLQRSLDSGNTAGLTDPFFSLKTITVESPTSLTLSFPDGTAANWYDTFLGSWQSTIVKPGTDFAKPVGAGPMQVTSYRQGESFTLVRWDGFWNSAEVNFAGVDLVHSDAAQPQAATAALQSGQVDIIQTTVDQLAAYSGDLSEVVVPNPNRVINMPICKKDGPLADARVRKAVNKAIDRETLNEVLYADTAPPATEFWPEGNRLFTPEVADELAYDPEAARQLLAEAGYADGVSFDIYVLASLSLPDLAVAMQPMLEEVGIDATIIPSPNYVAEFLTSGKPGMGLGPGGNAGRQKLNAWTGESLTNVCDYDDPELNALVAELAKVSDNSDEAVEIWGQINTIISEDALSVPLLFGSTLGAYDTSALVLDGVWPKGAFVVPDVYTSSMV